MKYEEYLDGVFLILCQTVRNEQLSGTGVRVSTLFSVKRTSI